jgi:hypothetical protein
MRLLGKVKLTLSLINKASNHEDQGGTGGIAASFFKLALDGGELTASLAGSFTAGERAPSTY